MSEHHPLYDKWIEISRRDDCFRQMVPSDVRVLLGELDRLHAENKHLHEQINNSIKALHETTPTNWATDGTLYTAVEQRIQHDATRIAELEAENERLREVSDE